MTKRRHQSWRETPSGSIRDLQAALTVDVLFLAGLVGYDLLLVASLWVRYVGLLTVVLCVGTLTIFFIAPAVTGCPLLNLTGQFLLKDFVLDSAALTVVARDAARRPSPATA